MARLGRQTFVYLGLPLVLLAGGFFLGRYYDSASAGEVDKTDTNTREIHGTGKLTSPLLTCEVSPQLGSKEYDVFENNVRTFVDQQKFAGRVSQMSVYFRELNNGAWFGINEKDNFTPASLLKVPTMISLFKLSETDPSILIKELSFDSDLDPSVPYFKPPKILEVGKKYQTEDIIERMIAYSDNDALMLLVNSFDDSIFQKTYKDLGMVPPKETDEDFMSTKTYASFFRILYNASYLSEADSEKALEILTRTTFTQGLVAGLPRGTVIAHKFGERDYSNTSDKQLHDCGIVYHPKNPYLLCIMARGTDYDVLANVIRDSSKLVWGEVAKRYPVK